MSRSTGDLNPAILSPVLTRHGESDNGYYMIKYVFTRSG